MSSPQRAFGVTEFVVLFLTCNPDCLVLQSGEAIALECQCRGELALRHRACAIKWTRVKGDNTCDICKAPITNLPQVSPRAPTERSDGDGSLFEDGDERAAHMLHGATPVQAPPHLAGGMAMRKCSRCDRCSGALHLPCAICRAVLGYVWLQ